MKNNASVKELLQFADSIYKLHGESIEETKKINPLGSTENASICTTPRYSAQARNR